jgi:hypothetical protein
VSPYFFLMFTRVYGYIPKIYRNQKTFYSRSTICQSSDIIPEFLVFVIFKTRAYIMVYTTFVDTFMAYLHAEFHMYVIIIVIITRRKTKYIDLGRLLCLYFIFDTYVYRNCIFFENLSPLSI